MVDRTFRSFTAGLRLWKHLYLHYEIGAQLREIAPRVYCILATRLNDVQRIDNGTAWVHVPMRSFDGTAGDPLAQGTPNEKQRIRVRYHYPPVHAAVYAVGVREIAILLSHLRAVAAGRSLHVPYFFVLEEDAELGFLLGSSHDWLTLVLGSLPTNWSVLQCAVIAEIPWMRHLQKRLISARRPYVSRNSLRGLSWPFSPPRVVFPNARRVIRQKFTS